MNQPKNERESTKKGCKVLFFSFKINKNSNRTKNKKVKRFSMDRLPKNDLAPK